MDNNLCQKSDLNKLLESKIQQLIDERSREWRKHRRNHLGAMVRGVQLALECVKLCQDTDKK